jgi:hypothetical protein
MTKTQNIAADSGCRQVWSLLEFSAPIRLFWRPLQYPLYSLAVNGFSPQASSSPENNIDTGRVSDYIVAMLRSPDNCGHLLCSMQHLLQIEDGR